MNLPGTQETWVCRSDVTRRWHWHGGARLGVAWEENPMWELGRVEPDPAPGAGAGAGEKSGEDESTAYLL